MQADAWTARPTRPHHADAYSAQAHATDASKQSELDAVYCRSTRRHRSMRAVVRCNRLQPAACTAAGQSQRVGGGRAEAGARRQSAGVPLAGCVTRAPRPPVLLPQFAVALPSLLPLLCAPLAALLCPYTRTSSCCAAARWLRLCATYDGVVARRGARIVAAGVALCARRARVRSAVERQPVLTLWLLKLRRVAHRPLCVPHAVRAPRPACVWPACSAWRRPLAQSSTGCCDASGGRRAVRH